MTVEIGVVQRLYREGVDAVERAGSTLTDAGWSQIICGRWSGTDTARHLVAVARWYHEWLERALDGDASPPFPGADLDRRNDEALLGVADLTGPAALSEFASTARSYLSRTSQHWDLPYGYPFGSVTVGLHCGVAAAEWHLHAWDLTSGGPNRHRPEQPGALFLAAGTCVAEAQGGVRGRLLRWLLPLGARRRPWSTMLERSGRSPQP